MFLKFISFICFSLIFFTGLTKQRDHNRVNEYALVKNKTLKELNLHSLEGHWNEVYGRYKKTKKESCLQIDFAPGEGYVNLTEVEINSEGNSTTLYKLEPNKHLKGKLDTIYARYNFSTAHETIINCNGTGHEAPEFILQIDPVLVVYDVELDHQIYWYIFSRNKTNYVDKRVIKQGIDKLVDAGIEYDSVGSYGYLCEDRNTL